MLWIVLFSLSATQNHHPVIIQNTTYWPFTQHISFSLPHNLLRSLSLFCSLFPSFALSPVPLLGFSTSFSWLTEAYGEYQVWSEGTATTIHLRLLFFKKTFWKAALILRKCQRWCTCPRAWIVLISQYIMLTDVFMHKWKIRTLDTTFIFITLLSTFTVNMILPF